MGNYEPSQFASKGPLQKKTNLKKYITKKKHSQHCYYRFSLTEVLTMQEETKFVCERAPVQSSKTTTTRKAESKEETDTETTKQLRTREVTLKVYNKSTSQESCKHFLESFERLKEGTTVESEWSTCS